MDIFNKDIKTKRMFLTLKIVFIVSGLLQGISVILTIPLFKELLSGNYNGMWIWLLYIGISALLCFVLNYTGYNMGNHMSVWEACDTQIHRIGSSITKLPLGWFDASSKGKISKAISTDVNTVAHYPSIVLPEILLTVSASIVIAISLLLISVKYGLIILVMGIVLAYFWKKNMNVLSEISEETAIKNRKMESVVVEFAQLQSVLRASGSLATGWNRLNTALIDDREATLTTLRKKSKNTSKYMFTVNLGAILIVIFSAFELNSGNIEIYTFIGVIVALIRFTSPLAGLLPYFSEVHSVSASIDRINSIVGAKVLPEPTEPVNIENIQPCDIEFRKVNFSYIEGKRVIKNMNLSVPAGKITALVGPSGSGKSTINRLIARFWDVDNGEILINGVNIKDIKTENLMSLVSMVFQEVYLFNTSIRENVAIANSNATEEEILEAAKKARLDEVVERLPNGWDTKVGEGGSSLSGGEKQRVSIARAFLKDAPILLLDEITSALDSINEEAVVKSLEELSKNRTVLVIAHRLYSIKNADSIAVVDDGEIKGFGTHSELLENSAKYLNLYHAISESEKWRLT